MTEEALVNLAAEAEETVEGVDANEETVAKTEEEKLFAGKYKTPEELEEGYKNLSQKLREKNPGAPEEYTFSVEGMEGFEDVVINKDDPRLQHFQGVFKELNISDKAASRLAAEFAKLEDANAINPQVEMEKLGPNAKETITKIETFFGKHAKSIGFTQDELGELASAMATASGVRAISKLIDRFNATSTVPLEAKGSQADNVDELLHKANELRSNPKFMSTPDMKRQYEKLMDQWAAASSRG